MTNEDLEVKYGFQGRESEVEIVEDNTYKSDGKGTGMEIKFGGLIDKIV